MVITYSDLFQNIRFYKYAHNSGPKGSPDMIFSAFDVKFHDKNEGMPPGACRPPKIENKLKTLCRMWAQESEKTKNNVDKVGSPPACPSVRPSGAS